MIQPNCDTGTGARVVAPGTSGHGSPGRSFGIMLLFVIGGWLVGGCQAATSLPTHPANASVALSPAPSATITVSLPASATATAKKTIIATRTPAASATPKPATATH